LFAFRFVESNEGTHSQAAAYREVVANGEVGGDIHIAGANTSAVNHEVHGFARGAGRCKGGNDEQSMSLEASMSASP